MDWQPLQKPAEMAESRLLEAILSGYFPINTNLPGERDLADQIGVTRPTLREALQRLARDGWLDIQQGKPTRVRDYWREGGLAVLAVLAENSCRSVARFCNQLARVSRPGGSRICPPGDRSGLGGSSDHAGTLLVPGGHSICLRTG